MVLNVLFIGAIVAGGVTLLGWWLKSRHQDKCVICGEPKFTTNSDDEPVCLAHSSNSSVAYSREPSYGPVSGSPEEEEEQEEEEEGLPERPEGEEEVPAKPSSDVSEWECPDHDAMMVWEEFPLSDGDTWEVRVCPEGGCMYLDAEEMKELAEFIGKPITTSSKELFRFMMEAARAQAPISA